MGPFQVASRIVMKNVAAPAIALLLLSVSTARATPASDAAFEEGTALMTAKQLRRGGREVPGGGGRRSQQRPRLVPAGVRVPEGGEAAIAPSRRTSATWISCPNMPDPFYGLGLCLLKTGDKSGALASLRHFVAVAPRPEVEGLDRSRGLGHRGADGAAQPADGRRTPLRSRRRRRPAMPPTSKPSCCATAATSRSRS